MALSFLGILGRGTLGRTFPSFDNFVHERTLIHRRLIVACRHSGETDMFVIALVPSSDADLYQYAYQMVIDDFKKVDFYKDFKESPSARNMNTNKNLAKDCEAKK